MPKRGSSSDTPGSDANIGAACAILFSIGLGLLSVAVPLFALRTGYTATEVGVLIALSGASQMGARLLMSPMMRRFPDKFFVISAGALLAISSVALLISSAWPLFIAAQLAQGVARAFFWTGSQTHAVRMSPSAVGALARINVASGVGQILGPILAGALGDRSLELALAFAVAFGALTIVPGFLLTRLPPFVKLKKEERVPGRLWRRPGVVHACAAVSAAGAWRGLLNSYVPVVLEQARMNSTTIGVLVAVANATSVLAGAVAGKVSDAGRRLSLVFGVLMTGIGLAAVAPLSEVIVACALALAFSGWGAGMLQTVGPAVASDAVHPEERGEAIAAAGVFRASALLLTPLGVAGMVIVAPVGAALAVTGVIIAVPSIFIRGLGRRGR